MLYKRVIVVILLVALAGAGYWFLWPASTAAAVVNGHAIPRADYEQRLKEVEAQYVEYGIELTAEMLPEIKQGILDDLIAEALLFQSAEAAGIVISAAEIDAYYQQVVSSYASEEEFLALLAENGYTIALFRSTVAEQLAVQRVQDQYIAANVDPGALLVTDAQIEELYDFYAAQYTDMPPLEDVRGYLEEELRDQILADLGVIETMIDELRAQATVKIKIKL